MIDFDYEGISEHFRDRQEEQGEQEPCDSCGGLFQEKYLHLDDSNQMICRDCWSAFMPTTCYGCMAPETDCHCAKGHKSKLKRFIRHGRTFSQQGYLPLPSQIPLNHAA